MQRRDRGIAQSLGISLTRRIKESRVLLVGAGGIGCELLKNLVCCGFGSGYGAKTLGGQNGVAPLQMDTAAQDVIAESKPEPKPEIIIIDLDTIDLSNLNRQFLFRKQHIKKPKAYVAKETASQFNPSVNIDAHHASIFDAKYDVDFFEGFDVVFNALDNLAARRHVNRMCLAANVPLIESGTTGYNGQAQAIRKGVTECYDCNPKPVQKSFPICTIRSTPSQSIHCIVWAKSYLFPELFGTSEEDSSDVAVTEGDIAEEVAKLKEEAQALKSTRGMMGSSGFARAIFDKVFHEDIERLRSMSEMWQSRKPPEGLRFDDIRSGIDTDLLKRGQTVAMEDQQAWSLADNLAVFAYSLDTLSNRSQAGEPVIEFDKDDKDTLGFVASAANLRSHIFGIPPHSEWEIKQMAGNIIPAIATSNALTASLCVMLAFKILRAAPISQQTVSEFAKPTASNGLPSSNSGHVSANGRDEGTLGGSKMVFLNSKSTERMITTQALGKPNPDCPVCSPVYAKLELPPGDATATLQHLVELLRAKLEYEDFSITTDTGVIYDPDLDDNLPIPLAELGIDGKGNGFLTVTDDSDDPKVDLVLSSKSSTAAAPGDVGAYAGLSLSDENLQLPLKPKKKPEINGDGEVNGHAEPEPVSAADATAGEKRKREADEEAAGTKKRAKAAAAGVDGQDVVVVEDDGAILLED